MRQRPHPFGGAVGPTNTAPLVLCEEWESGEGIGVLGPGYQQLPARWSTWQPPTSNNVLSWLDALAQAATVYNGSPGTDGLHQWSGALLPYPAAPDGPQGFSWRVLYGYQHFPAFQKVPPEAVEQWSAIVLGFEDLLAGEGKFLSIGLVQQLGGVTAALAGWADSQNLSSAQQLDFGGFGITGALFRVDILSSALGDATQVLARVSTDGGLGWFPIGFEELPGTPQVIGFGTSGRWDSLQAIGNGGVAGNAFLRLYDQPPSGETALFVNLDGGRNWP